MYMWSKNAMCTRQLDMHKKDKRGEGGMICKNCGHSGLWEDEHGNWHHEGWTCLEKANDGFYCYCNKPEPKQTKAGK